MLPSSQDLSFFLEISHTLNLSRAAERVGVSQSALSQAMQRLEEKMGTALLIRSKTGVKLTRAGVHLARNARELLAQWNNLKQDSLREEIEVRGQYSIGMHPSVALYSLPTFIHKLMQHYPHLELDLIHDHSRNITEQVISFHIDFGIVINPIRHPDLVIIELCEDLVTLWKNPHLDIDPRAPHTYPLIYTPQLIQAQAILEKLRKSRLHFTRTIRTSDLEVVKTLIQERAGIGILPTRVAKLPSTKHLVPFDDKSPTFKDRICLIYRADVAVSEAMKMLLQDLKAGLKNL